MFKRMVILLGLVLALTVCVPVWGLAQTIADAQDNTTLKQIIIFGRHGVRSPTTGPSILSQMAVDSYPSFEVQPGYLTPHGRQAEVLLGTYYRKYLLHEGLLTSNDQKDAVRSYFRSNSIERSYETAAAFQGALIPNSTVSVHSFTFGQPDPVFDPILANVAKVDPVRAATEVQAIFNSGAALASAYSGEYSLIRSVLFDYPLGTQPPPDTPPSKVDPTSQAITLTANTTPPLYTGGVIAVGGLSSTIDAADPFVMQYADGFPLDQVAWGRLTLNELSQQTRIINLRFNIEMLSPYLNKVQSSNAASHILRTMEQAVHGFDMPGAFGDARSRAVVVISSDAYVAGLAGLLQLHWQLPGYQPDFCAPGGALVFELRQSKKSKKYLVRAFYTAQTFDQLRNLTPLTLHQPPATIQLLIPGGSKSATDADVNFGVFHKLLRNAIGYKYVEDTWKEVPPGVLTDVPLT
jgi:4-phytase/acid phosphatase